MIELESNISEYPLINELVIITFFDGKLYYSRKVKYLNWPNHNLDFAANTSVSGKPNNELYSKALLKGKKESILRTK